MSHRLPVRPVLALAASALTVFALAGSAFAASASSPVKLNASRTGISRTVTLSAARVRQLVDFGAKVTFRYKVVSGEQGADVRLFVYQRALNRGGAPKSPTPAAFKASICDLARLPNIKTGTHTVSMHVEPQYRKALLRAGSVTVGIEAFGYGS
jgi:hypothetical protein